MRIITPSEAIANLEQFHQRVDRLELNVYKNKRFRTMDLGRLKFEVHRLTYFCSIAIHARNTKRAKAKIELTTQYYQKARKILEA